VTARIDGVLRGLIHPGTAVAPGLKLADIDPRGRREYCHTISDKARAIAGAALEGVMRYCNDSRVTMRC
jgi:xanthine dehydrogenase accessory factor